MRRRATRSRASMSWCGCAKRAERILPSEVSMPRHGGAFDFLLDFLARINAPQARLFDPAVEAFAGEAAPAILAALHARQHAVLQLRRDGARRIRLVAQFEQILAPGLR